MPKSEPVTHRIIIYDDQCRFCTRFANWCVKKQKEFVIMSVKNRETRALLRRLGVQFIDLQTIYFIEGKLVSVRSKAIFKILGFVNYPWKAIVVFSYLPVKLTDYFYKLFARYRYSI